MIQIACPQCGLNLLLPDHLLGTEVICSGCKATVDTAAAEKMEPRPARRDDAPARADETPDRAGEGRRDDRDDRDREPARDDNRPRRPSATGTCICLVIGGIVSLLSGLVFLGVTFYQGAVGPHFGPPDILPLVVFSSILILVTNVIPAIFQFIGAACLARLEGYGLVMAAAILALSFGAVQTLFCGLAHLAVLASAFPTLADEEMPLRLLSALLLLGAGVFNLIAGGITLGTLSSGPVARVYNRNFRAAEDDYRPRRSRNRDIDRDWDREGRWGRGRWGD